MTQGEFEKLLDTLAKGWTAGEYDAIIGHFAEDIFYSDSLHYSFFDRSSLLQFFRNEGLEQTCIFHNALFDESKQLGAAEYTYKGTYQYHGTVWVKIENEEIVSWREYQHVSNSTWEEFWKIDERNRP